MTTVYRVYDADEQLLYVGCTTSFAERRKAHQSTSAWFADAHSWDLHHYDDHDEARAAERAAIQTENPLHNKRMNPSFEVPRRTGPLLGCFVNGAEIRRRRQRRGIRTGEFARRVGLHDSSLRHVELGSRNPSPEILYRIAKVLECDASELLDHEQAAS